MVFHFWPSYIAKGGGGGGGVWWCLVLVVWRWWEASSVPSHSLRSAKVCVVCTWCSNAPLLLSPPPRRRHTEMDFKSQEIAEWIYQILIVLVSVSPPIPSPPVWAWFVGRVQYPRERNALVGLFLKGCVQCSVFRRR